MAQVLVATHTGGGVNALPTLTHRFSTLVWRKGEGIFNAPPRPQATANRSVTNADNFRPLLERSSFPSKGYLSCVAAVIGLFQRSRPSAIIRSVITVIIDAVEGISLRAFTHIRQEGFKVSPSLTDANSSPAVAIKSSDFRIVAPLVNAPPNAVFRRLIFSVTAHLFGMQTPTGTTQAAGERISVHRFFTSAHTATKPMGVASDFRGVPANSCPSSKGFSSQISEIARGWHTTILTQNPIEMGVLA